MKFMLNRQKIEIELIIKYAGIDIQITNKWNYIGQHTTGSKCN